ncbi:hypothetical protein [Streptomyces eurythermus]
MQSEASIWSARPALPAGTGPDGELVVWESGRLAFERLQQRLARRGAGAPVAGPLLVFGLVHAGGNVTGWPYARRRAALESLFADRRLQVPLTLCPSTTDPAVARGWLEWTAAGLEELCFMRLDEPYVRGARSWRKYKVRATADAIVGAVTGSLAAPPDGAAGPLRRSGPPAVHRAQLVITAYEAGLVAS